MARVLSLYLFVSCLSCCFAGIIDRVRQCNKIKDTCNFCEELTENNLSSAHAWFVKESNRLEKKLPIPNLELAMGGYDVIAGDHFAHIDPGRRNQIFEPLRNENDKTYLNSFIEGIDSEIDCAGEFSVIPVKNLDQYATSKIYGTRLFLGNFSEERSLFSDLPLPFGLDSKSNPNAFVGKAHCVTASVEISPFEVPVFTPRFESALKIINDAAKNPGSSRSQEIAFTFFKTYGTHFMKSTILGSKIVFGKNFSSKTSSSDDDKKRVSCLSEKAKKSLQDARGKLDFLKEKFISNLADCESSKSSSLGIEPDHILAFGPLPSQTLNTWSTDTIEDPVPIDFELIKISHLFQQPWLDSITRKGEEQMNGDRMYKFYQTMLAEYCRAVQGKECRIQPHENSISFAYNDQTDVETTKLPEMSEFV